MNPQSGIEFFDGNEETRLALQELASVYPTIDAALAKIVGLRSELSLPKGTIHVISDIHGEYKKLKHVINNASGSLRPLVEETFGTTLTDEEKRTLLTLIYYPRETFARLEQQFRSEDEKQSFIRVTVRRELEILRHLTSRYSLTDAIRVFPEPYKHLFWELIAQPEMRRNEHYVDTVLDEFAQRGKEVEFLRLTARLIRNLLVSELIVAGDLGDRGPRMDRVIDYIMRQPRVRMTWGNHDASWIGACLGHTACIATVLRLSLRYRRLSQLEEGYGIPMVPLEHLARSVYASDPATCFPCKGEGLRDAVTLARMQKAIAIIQFKLEGQLIQRNPQYELEHRNLLHRIDPVRGCVEIEGKEYPMLDTFFPTIDWNDPYTLSPEEERCVNRMQQSFLQSAVLWAHIKYVVQRGSFYLIRDNHLIFHACVPVDENGQFLPFEIDSAVYRGRELFEALQSVFHRAFRDRQLRDLDLLWYLWSGPKSPWFGKDKMATFEGYFVADKESHKEKKNPYFLLLHSADFCKKILREFGITSDKGLIVNGHVPVKIEQGESPLKDSGLAVTIDGAFSEAYGDAGYTLILDSLGTRLAQHHHFESVSDAITKGADIIPTVEDLRCFDQERYVGDTERGEEIRTHIALLERLIQAYRYNVVPESLIDRR